MYVARSAGDDPMGPYAFRAKLRTDPDDRFYAIDGTVLTMPGGARYFVWCGRPSPVGQGLYIARMANPWTLAGPRVALPASGFGCGVVREGPVALRHRDGGRVFLVYSACAADTPDYKLGMLSIDPAADPMDPSAWRQHPDPVFGRDDRAEVYGPGHNTFFRSPDGREDWITYHAKSGIARTYADRSARAQRFTCARRHARFRASAPPRRRHPRSLRRAAPGRAGRSINGPALTPSPAPPVAARGISETSGLPARASALTGAFRCAARLESCTMPNPKGPRSLATLISRVFRPGWSSRSDSRRRQCRGPDVLEDQLAVEPDAYEVIGRQAEGQVTLLLGVEVGQGIGGDPLRRGEWVGEVDPAVGVRPHDRARGPPARVSTRIGCEGSGRFWGCPMARTS